MRFQLSAALAVGVVMLAGSAGAQSYQQAWRACLQNPFEREMIAKHCTTIIDAGRLTPLERAIALNNRAEAGGNGNIEAEIRDLDEAIGLAPTVAKLYYNRGTRLAGKPDLARAIADFDAAIRLDPRYAVAWTGRGEAYFELKQYDRAIHDLSEAIRLAPTYMHPLYNPYESRARAKEAKGDAKGAAADRALYLPIWNRANSYKPGPNVSGRRAWEGWLTR